MLEEVLQEIDEMVWMPQDTAGLAPAAEGFELAKERFKKIIRRHMEDGGWIPCGERMPEEPYGCIVTVVDTNSGTLDDFENVLPYHAGYDGGQWNDENGGKIPFEVTAWQKCPSPYRSRQKAAGRDYRQNIMDRFMRTE